MHIRDFTAVQILRDHFSPFRFSKGRRFSVRQLILFLVVPLVAGIGLAWLHPVISDKHQGTFLAVYSILGAVLIGLLPIAQNVLAFSAPTTEKEYSEAEYESWKQQISRLQVLRELYADICYTVILLVISLAPIMFLESSVIPPIAKHAIVTFVYFVGVSVAMSFLHITSSVYLVLDHHAKHIHANLVRHGPGVKANGGERTAYGKENSA